MDAEDTLGKNIQIKGVLMINYIKLEGEVTQDPKFIETKRGGGCSLNIKHYFTEKRFGYFSLIRWGEGSHDLADSIQVGDIIIVEGQITINKGKDGKYYTNIVIDKIEIPKREAAPEEEMPMEDDMKQENEPNPPEPAEEEPGMPTEEEIPF